MPEIRGSLTFLVIGPKNSGKTVFLVSLGECTNVIKSRETVHKLRELAKKLEEGEPLPPTDGITTLKFKFKYNGARDSVLLVNLPDYDGHFVENLTQIYDSRESAENTQAREDSGAETAGQSAPIRELHRIIEEADGFILLMPAGDESRETMKKLKEIIDSFLELASAIYDEKGFVRPPLAIVVNKWDKADGFKSPREDRDAESYIKSNKIYRHIYEKLENFFGNVAVIPVSAFGSPASGGAPEADSFIPYRVSDPIVYLINQYFKTLETAVDSALAAKNCLLAAEILLGTKPLWKNWPSGNFTGLLRESLHGCYVNLADRLKASGTPGQYDEAWKRWPESALFDYFTPAQKEELENLRGALERRARRKKTKFWGRAAVVASIVAALGFIWGALSFGDSFKDDFSAAMNADLRNQYPLLEGFLKKYEPSLTARIIYGSHLDRAREKLQDVETSTRERVSTGLAKLEEMRDPCARAVEASHLWDFAQSMGGLVSGQEMEGLEEALARGKELCASRMAVETSGNLRQMPAGTGVEEEKSPAGRGEAGNLAALKKRVRGQAARWDGDALDMDEPCTERAEPESGAIRGFLADAWKFAARYGNDASPRARKLAHSLAAELEELPFGEISGPIREEARDEETSDLRYKPQERLMNALKLGAIRKKMREIALAADKFAIESIPQKIDSIEELEMALDSIDELRAPKTIPGTFGVYQRPQKLAAELDDRARNIHLYLHAIKNGLPVNWEILANAENAVGLACPERTSRETELSIRFEGPLPDRAPEDIGLCRRLAGGRGHVFHTAGKIRPFEGYVELHGPNGKHCRSHIEITANDIIRLCNNGHVLMDLRHDCAGIRLDLLP